MFSKILPVFARRRNLFITSSIKETAIYQLRSIKKRNYLSVPKDVVIYDNHTPGLLRLIGLCGVAQWAVISYMSSVMYQTLPAFFSWIPIDKDSAKMQNKNGKHQRLPLADWNYRVGFSLFTFVASSAILYTSFMFCYRSVSSLTLLRNSDKVYISTFTPYGTKRGFIEKVTNISAIQPRNSPMTQVPLKIKDCRFHFLLDKNSGKFPQASLYDRTVGIRRDFGGENTK